MTTQDKEMSLLDHIEELRSRILKIVFGTLVPIIIAYTFYREIFAFLMLPMKDPIFIRTLIEWFELNGIIELGTTVPSLQAINPSDTFIASIKVAFVAGLFLSIPWIIYQIWAFVAPALSKKEKSYTFYVVFFASLFFIFGGFFAYFIVLPFTLNFLANFGGPDIVNQWSVLEYFDFVLQMLLVFGIVFEMPLLAFVLTRLGLLSADFLRKYRRYAIVIIFIIAAVLTPPDVASQIMMGIPMLILYELSIWIAVVFRKKSPFDDE